MGIPMVDNGASSPRQIGFATGVSHIGLVRYMNEDSYLCINRPGSNSVLLAVADGMGGHDGGEVASFFVTRALLAEWNRVSATPFRSKDDIINFLEGALVFANHHVHQINKKLKIRWIMGTTLSMGIYWKDAMIIGHIGDSRCYRLRNRRLKQLTQDHNWMTEMTRAGLLSQAEARRHPMGHMLTNCLGGREELQLEVMCVTAQPGDRFMFCSDGVSAYMVVRMISDIMRDAETEGEAAQGLVNAALEAGGEDNITAACLFI